MRRFFILTVIFASMGFMSATVTAGHKHGKHYMKKMDANGDQKISQDEFMQYSESRFAKMDADSDGFVVAEELKQYRKEKYKKHKESKEQAE